MPDPVIIPACAYLVHGGYAFPQSISFADPRNAEKARQQRDDASLVTPLVPRQALQLVVDALQALAGTTRDDVASITDVIARARGVCATAAMSPEAQAYAQAIKRAAR